VTVFGESAGGVNVYTLLLAQRAKGLFERAIVESGGLTSTTADEAENFTDDSMPGAKNSSNEVIVRMLGADRTAAKAKLAAMADAATADFLRARTPAQLFDAYAGKHEVGMIDMPLVVHDGALLPTGSWLTAFARADGWNRVPVIVGTNREEAKLFPRFVNEPEYQAAADALSRMWKARGVDAPAAAMRASGQHDVFAYRFDWHDEPTVLGADVSRMLGAAHGIEVPFVFGHFDIGPLTSWVYDARSAPSRGLLSAAMMGYWTTFARTGTPNGGTSDLPTWSPAPAFMVLDAPVSSLHMSDAVEEPSRIIADVDADARLPTQREKCAVFLAMTGMGEGLTKADYPHAGAHGCADFPADAYPWEAKK
jgi:para-nitrobenzyl esterase